MYQSIDYTYFNDATKDVFWGLFGLVFTVVTLLLKVSVVRQLSTALQVKVKTTDFCQINMIYSQVIGLNHFQLFLKSSMTM